MCIRDRVLDDQLLGVSLDLDLQIAVGAPEQRPVDAAGAVGHIDVRVAAHHAAVNLVAIPFAVGLLIDQRLGVAQRDRGAAAALHAQHRVGRGEVHLVQQ